MIDRLLRAPVAVSRLVKNHGAGWVTSRLGYELQARAGVQRLRFRKREWEEDELKRWLKPDIPSDVYEYIAYRTAHTPRFLFESADRLRYAGALQEVLGESGRRSLETEATQIRQGDFRYFSGQSGHLGFPPVWHTNPFTGQQVSPTDHWSRIPMYSSRTGDLKYVWEPGRFASAYVLARAHWSTGDEKHAETFWQLIESWGESNPPNHGAHWRCGQETSLRIMAWCFGLYATTDSPSATAQRIARLVGMIGAEADRVARDHVYARLQRNNHAISEGAGLWTVGILFPEFEHADRWRALGRQILSEEADRQIYADGSYVQHSTNYHRLMLHDFLWAIRIGDLNGHSLPDTVRQRVQKSGEMLFQLQDDVSGRTPNVGGNDGALILPLNSCEYGDHRGVLGTWHFLFTAARLYERGPWEEDLIWFFGPEAIEAGRTIIAKRPLAAHDGGYYTLRNTGSWAMIRCPSYRDRPAQADGLHLDLWRQGTNVACDPGTYLYYAEEPWNNGLTAASVHNTVTVDGVDQMERGPKFLWLTWLRSRVLHHKVSEHLSYFEGAHDGYERLPDPVTHRRAVLADGDDTWIVIDDLLSEAAHEYRLHWLLADLDPEIDLDQRTVRLDIGGDSYQLALHSSDGAATSAFRCVRGTSDSTLDGWRSVRYGEREPALSVSLTTAGVQSYRMISIFSPSGSQPTVAERRILVGGDIPRLTVELSPPGRAGILRQAILTTPDGPEALRI